MNAQQMIAADNNAISRMLAVRPIWCGLVLAADAVALPANTLLHAGPPFSSPAEVTKPILNSACVAAVYEGLATDFESAALAIANLDIQLKSAQDFNIVTPLAAVVSASMWLHRVVDQNNPELCAYAPINGGNGAAMRLGLRDQKVVDHMHWLNGEFADLLAQLKALPIDLIPIAAKALAAGDDCHGRTIAGTKQIIATIENELGSNPGALGFLQDGPSFFLNLWMAACKCMLNAAIGVEHSSLISAIGANGLHSGIQVAGLPGQWFTALADVPQGDIGDYAQTRALGAIGDSSVADACGFGAMAMNYSSAQQQGLGSCMPTDGLQRPTQILSAVHTQFGQLNFRTCLCAETIVRTRKPLLISLGILDKTGDAGRLGGGIFTMPVTPFNGAFAALKSKK
jgi:hypothetical protein